MLFNSLQFAVFFPVVVILYFAAPYRCRTPLLLFASCLFYMAFIPEYILILAITILIDYSAGIILERVSGKRRTMVLAGSIGATCAVLFVFKYFRFGVHTLCGLTGLAGIHLAEPAISIILPIGLSFHTFQSLSYVIEVYRNRQKAEHKFLVYATYVMFFPQLVAGPIERPQNLLHQFWEHHLLDYEQVTSGLRRMALGFFKKLVIADRLALYVNDVYAAPAQFNGLQLTLASLFFAYQIYCDFSGYSDIALGSAQILGFRLMENFDRPYSATSISEFWRRWHISLSTWFRDYVYFPLGGNRVTPWHWVINVLITFGISGLWHGANWTYVAWGLLNGIYLIAGAATERFRERLFAPLGLCRQHPLRIALSIASTFALTCAGWVIFRAQSLSDAGYIFTHFWRGWNFHAIGTEQFLPRQLPVALAAIFLLESFDWLKPRFSLTALTRRLPLPLRWTAYSAIIIFVILFGVYRQGQFIYFQF